MAWLVAHVRMLGLDEREKSLQMIRQLAGPLYSENTLQFYNERSVTGPALLACRCVVRSQHHREQASHPLVLTLPFPGSRSPTTSSSIQVLSSPPPLALRQCTFRVVGLSLLLPLPYHSLTFLFTHSFNWLSRDLVCVSVSRGFNPVHSMCGKYRPQGSLTTFLQGSKFQKTS